MTASALLSVRGVGKRFGALQALAGIDLDFHAGEIHAILGENGAGKSTLMHVLDGVLRPDAGTILLDGLAVTFASPRDARRAGIGMVHQHFTLFEALTVTENLALSLPHQPRWSFDASVVAADAQAFAQRIGLQLSSPDTPVALLPVGARQRLEILKALASAGRVLILDEPTAVLTPQETRQLFAMLRELRAQKRLVVFITHKLREVKEVADRVTIMRRGRVIGTYATSNMSESEMAERMVGGMPARNERPPEDTSRQSTAPAHRRSALSVSRLSTAASRGVAGLTDVSFAVRAGEIFGVAGVDGNGQRELFEVLVGLRHPSDGTVSVGGRALTAFHPRAALAAGIGHIPPDRQRQGLVLSMTVEENLLLHRAILDRLNRYGLLRREAIRRFATDSVREYAIEAASLDAPVRSLSGGNQQRVIVARELAEPPVVLVTANPTRGLDVAGARAVKQALTHVAAHGCAVVLISTDLDEVLELSDRVAVLFTGQLSTALEPPIDAEQLGLLMAAAPPASRTTA